VGEPNLGFGCTGKDQLLDLCALTTVMLWVCACTKHGYLLICV